MAEWLVQNLASSFIYSALVAVWTCVLLGWPGQVFLAGVVVAAGLLWKAAAAAASSTAGWWAAAGAWAAKVWVPIKGIRLVKVVAAAAALVVVVVVVAAWPAALAAEWLLEGVQQVLRDRRVRRPLAVGMADFWGAVRDVAARKAEEWREWAADEEE